ncbi:MAG: ribokinase [Candidatus Dormiibacterota bacterium]
MSAVVVVGSFSMDLTAEAPRMPRLGETVLGTGFLMVPGGKGNNQAVASVRAGAETAVVGCIGSDLFGQMVEAACRAEGLDTTWLERVAGAETGVAQIAVNANAENSIIVVPRANLALDRERVAAAHQVTEQARVILTQLEVPIDAVRAALRAGRAAGALNLLNPAPAADLSQDLLSMVDICLPNEHEAAQLTGVTVEGIASAVGAADALVARGCGAAVITLGALGAVYSDGRRRLRVPPLLVRAVDTVAAGDAFCGVLAAELAGGQDLDRALQVAAAAGALATTKRGATTSLPHRSELDAVLETSPKVEALLL